MSNLIALADEYGRLDAMKKALEEKLAALKAELKAAGVEKIEGKMFIVTQKLAIRQTLDTNAVKAKMGQDWYDDNSKLAEVTTVLVKAKAPVNIEI